LFAGEALDTADACTLRDGRVYRATGAAADGNARIFGWTAAPASAGEAVTLYDHVTIEYGTGLSMGTLFYLSGDTPGGLDTDPSPGGTTPCAVALDSTRVHVVSTWGDGAGSGGGADPLTVHPWSGVTALVDETGSPRLIVGGDLADANPVYGNAVFGNDDPAYGLNGLNSYSGNSIGVYGKSDSYVGVLGRSQSDAGVTGISATSGKGVYGQSDSGAGLDGYSNTGTGAHIVSFAGIGLAVQGAPAIQATGAVFIANQSAPATPTNGGVLYVESGSLKYKGSGGTVTVLGPA
jgi:hypothetical protein